MAYGKYMKAQQEMPGSKSETAKSLSGSKSEHTLTGSLWARYRQLEARLSNIESKASALRRDCDRIEKKQSRASLAEPENKGNGHQEAELRLPDPFVRS